MMEKKRWAFIIDKDDFVRLSLKKILDKYGFRVEEIDNFSQIEKRKKDIKNGVIIADLDIGELEREIQFLKRWSDRLILMSPSTTDELLDRLKRLGIRHIIKKPVEPNILRKKLREISFPIEIEA